MSQNPEHLEGLNKKFFNRWARFYDAGIIHRVYFEPLYQRILVMLKDKIASGTRFLDIACGTGEIIYRLAKANPGAELLGVDFSAEMILKARKKNVHLGNTRFAEANAISLPFIDATLDTVLCSEAFHHFVAPEKVLQEVRRVLKPGGSFILVDPAFNNKIWKGIATLVFKPIENACRYYSRTELENLLSANGFVVRKSFTYHFNNFIVSTKV